MSLLLLFSGTAGGGGTDNETLASGDLTTAFMKWYASKGHPRNEDIRGDLNTEYSTDNADIMPNLVKFLKERT